LANEYIFAEQLDAGAKEYEAASEILLSLRRDYPEHGDYFAYQERTDKILYLVYHLAGRFEDGLALAYRLRTTRTEWFQDLDLTTAEFAGPRAMQAVRHVLHFSEIAIDLAELARFDEALNAAKECNDLSVQIFEKVPTMKRRMGLAEIARMFRLFSELLAVAGYKHESRTYTEKSLHACRTAVDLERTDAKAKMQLAYLLVTLPETEVIDPAQALSRVDEAIEAGVEANSAAVWQLRGLAHYYAGEWQKSIEAMEQCVQLQESDSYPTQATITYLILANSNWHLELPAKAMDWRSKAESLRPRTETAQRRVRNSDEYYDIRADQALIVRLWSQTNSLTGD